MGIYKPNCIPLKVFAYYVDAIHLHWSITEEKSQHLRKKLMNSFPGFDGFSSSDYTECFRVIIDSPSFKLLNISLEEGISHQIREEHPLATYIRRWAGVEGLWNFAKAGGSEGLWVEEVKRRMPWWILKENRFRPQSIYSKRLSGSSMNEFQIEDCSGVTTMFD